VLLDWLTLTVLFPGEQHSVRATRNLLFQRPPTAPRSKLPSAQCRPRVLQYVRYAALCQMAGALTALLNLLRLLRQSASHSENRLLVSATPGQRLRFAEATHGQML